MTSRTFVCYSRADQDFVLDLAARLRDDGVDLWLDQWSVQAGDDWDLAVDDALHDCDRLLVVLSPRSVRSREVRSELRTALDEEKAIVPVLMEKCRVPRHLRLVEYIDCTAGRDAIVDMLPVIRRALASRSGQLDGQYTDAGEPNTQVVLLASGDRRVQVVVQVRELTDLPLAEAKKLVDEAPSAIPLAEGVRTAAAQERLESAGATVELRRDGWAVPDTRSFDVELVAVGDMKIQVIKQVRALSKLGLKESKRLVDEAPSIVLSDLDAEAASTAASNLRGVGATVRLHGRDSAEPRSFDVELVAVGDMKIQVIKQVRALSKLGLKESKRLVDEAPSIVLSDLDAGAASTAASNLRGVGATVRVHGRNSNAG